MPKVKRFTSEQIAEARRMHADRIPWVAIGERFGVSDDCIRRHAQRGYREKRNEAASRSWGNRRGTKWSAQETENLVQWRLDCVPWDYVAARLGRSKQSCQVKYHEESHGRRNPADRAEARQARGPLLASRTDLTGIICGDPAPGRSALETVVPPDRRRMISLAPVRATAIA